MFIPMMAGRWCQKKSLLLVIKSVLSIIHFHLICDVASDLVQFGLYTCMFAQYLFKKMHYCSVYAILQYFVWICVVSLRVFMHSATPADVPLTFRPTFMWLRFVNTSAALPRTSSILHAHKIPHIILSVCVMATKEHVHRYSVAFQRSNPAQLDLLKANRWAQCVRTQTDDITWPAECSWGQHRTSPAHTAVLIWSLSPTLKAAGSLSPPCF